MVKSVLQFFSVLDSGGAENRMMDVYNCIDSSIVKFDFAVVHEGKHFFDEYIYSKGSKKYVFPNPHDSIIRNYKEILQFLRNNPQFTAVHAHVNVYNGIVLLAAKRAGIKNRIAHARDSAPPDMLLKDKIKYRFGQFLIGMSATKKVAISKDAAETVFGKRTVKKNDYTFIPNAIDQKKYIVIDNKQRESIRKSIGVNIDEKAYVMVANFGEKKNHLFLLDIAKSLKDKNHKYKLFLIGDGNMRGTIERKILELGLNDTVMLLGTRKDVPKILGAFDAMIFPSLFECFGGVVLESQLLGVPAFVSDRVPKTADVEIDMVKYLSLNETPDYWASYIINNVDDFTWNYERALRAFEKKGYIIEQTAQKYLELYGFNKDTIEKALIRKPE